MQHASTAGLIRAIHAGKRTLGLDETTYREMLLDVTGLDSCRRMSDRQLRLVLSRLRQSGFVQTPKEPTPQELKIRALWLSLAKAGVVRDQSRKAMGAYISRMTQKSKNLTPVIESLKRWCQREGVEYED